MNKVQYFRMAERTSLVPNGWKLNAHGRLAWLHRLLWRWLEKMGAVAQSYDEVVKTVRLPCSDDVFRAILEQRSGLFEVSRKPKEILIGPHTLDELYSCPEMRDMMMKATMTARAGYGREFYNLPIRVVPQMEGVIVLD